MSQPATVRVPQNKRAAASGGVKGGGLQRLHLGGLVRLTSLHMLFKVRFADYSVGV